jgi:general secretion pathway protein L
MIGDRPRRDIINSYDCGYNFGHLHFFKPVGKMPGKILGLEINEKSVTAVQVMSGLKGYNLISCSRIGVEENDLEKALFELSQKIDLKSDNSFVSISGAGISFRNIKIPFKDPKKIRQTLPFELETLVPFPVDELIVDFNIIDHADQTEILAVSARKSHLSEYLSKLAIIGIDPDIVDINPIPTVSWVLNQDNRPENGLYIDIEIERNRMILFKNRRIVLIREFYSTPDIVRESEYSSSEDKSEDNAFVQEYEEIIESLCEEVLKTLHSFGWQNGNSVVLDKVLFGGIGAIYAGTENILSRFFECPVERVNVSRDNRLRMDYNISRIYKQAVMDNALAISMRDNKKAIGFNLRQGEFQVKKRYFGPKQEIKKAVILLILFLIFLISDLGIDYYSLKEKYNLSKQTVTEQRIKMYPETKNIKDNELAIKQIEVQQKGSPTELQGIAKTNQKVLDILKDIALRIPESYDMDVTNMIIDQKDVRISGDADSYKTIDSMENDLKPSPLYKSVEIGSTKKSGNRIRFDLKLTRAN